HGVRWHPRHPYPPNRTRSYPVSRSSLPGSGVWWESAARQQQSCGPSIHVVACVLRVTRRGDGNMCGARGVATCDGRQPLHMRSQQLRERRCLGFAQLWELGGHVGHRTVVLAQLLTRSDFTGGGSISLVAERARQCLGTLLWPGLVTHRVPVCVD